MIETLRTYNSQFKFIPEIVNAHLISKNYKQIVLCGMGGSHLAAGILKTIQPGIDIYVHRDYDLPSYTKSFLESSLLIACSYSGNTEEVISFYNKIKQLYDFPVLSITCGGELLSCAQKYNDPHIVLPKTSFVPRTALGIMARSLAFVLKDKNLFNSLGSIELNISQIEDKSKKIIDSIGSKTPIIYTSNQNLSLAYNWKIKFNETAKKIAFFNVFPESNHNELESFEFDSSVNQYIFILLTDLSDHPRIQKRFAVFKEILKQKSINFIEIDISNKDMFQKVFDVIVLGDFMCAQIAEKNKLPIEDVPLIEDFKRKLV